MTIVDLTNACPTEVQIVDSYRLRRWTEGDVDLLESLILKNMEQLRPWMAWIASEPMDRSERLSMISNWHTSKSGVNYGIFVGNTAIGACGLNRSTIESGVLQVGVWVDSEWTGKGVATNVVKKLVELAIGVNGVEALEYRHDRANEASGHVAKNAGFDFIGDVPGAPVAPSESGFDSVWHKNIVD